MIYYKIYNIKINFLKIFFFLVTLLHVAVIMNPSFCANLVTLFGGFFKNLRIILHGDSRWKKARMNFFLLEDFQHPIDAHSLAELGLDPLQIAAAEEAARAVIRRRMARQ